MAKAKTIRISAAQWRRVRTQLGNTIRLRNSWRTEAGRRGDRIAQLQSDLATATKERDRANAAANGGQAQRDLQAANTAIVKKSTELLTLHAALWHTQQKLDHSAEMVDAQRYKILALVKQIGALKAAKRRPAPKRLGAKR